MATTIATNVGTASGAATGNPGQGHLIYGPSTGKWYCFYLSSTQTLNLAYASAIGSTWTISSAPFTLANPHNQEGRDFGFAPVTISGADYVHMCSTYAVSTTSTKSYHTRFKLDNGVNPNTGWTTSVSETQETTRSTSSSGIPSGASVIIDSAGKVAECNSFISSGSAMTDQRFLQYPNADTAASWTIGTPTQSVSFATTTYVTSNAFADLGSSNLLNVCDNASSTGGMTQLEWSKWNGSSWSAAATALSAIITTTSTCNWGMVARTTTEVHVVALSNNSSTFVHRIFNGTSWANGASIATLTTQINCGIFLATDGTSVWAITIDSTNRIAYTKYSGGTWSAWATLEAAGATNRFRVTGYPKVAGGGIGVIWTEVNGSNFNIVGSVLGMPQTASITVATETTSAVALGHTVTGTVEKSIGVAHETASETGWSSAKGTGTAFGVITAATETGAAPSIGRSVSGTVEKSITVAAETTSVIDVTGRADLPAYYLGLVEGSASASNLSASGSGSVEYSIGVATETSTEAALAASGSGTLLKSISVASETGSASNVSHTTGTATRDLLVSSVLAAPVNVTYLMGGEVIRPLGAVNETTSLVSVSTTVSGTATCSIGQATGSTSEAALSAKGTGGTSNLIGVAHETTSAPQVIGLGEGVAALGFILTTGTVTDLSASGSGTTSYPIGVAHETTSGLSVAGDIVGSVNRSITTATASGAPTAVSRATSGTAGCLLGVSQEIASAGTLEGSLLDTTRGLGLAAASVIAHPVGQQLAVMFATLGNANASVSGVSPHGVLDTALFQVRPEFLTLIN